MNELKPSLGLMCANCGAELKGEFCHECGQSIKSVIQPVSHMLEDAGDLFFHLDERVIHTLPPLYTKPGFLTLEYFSGRRVRYIAPFRLMFVFCLMAFFFMHLAISDTHIGDSSGESAKDDIAAFQAAATPDEVREIYKNQAQELTEAMTAPGLPGAAKSGIELTRNLVRDAANRRLVQMKAEPIAADSAEATGGLRHRNADSWFMGTTVVDIGWLPDSINRRLALGVAHFKANIVQIIDKGPQKDEAIHRIMDGFFSVLPQSLFLMLPVFALILKLFYVFRRRLYMEHIIVALHSHAFLFISLLGLMILGFAKAAISPHLAFAGVVITLVQIAMWVWMPVYLLVMQKRVYRQGWPMTILKYWLIGSIYFWLLLFVLCVAVLIGASH